MNTRGAAAVRTRGSRPLTILLAALVLAASLLGSPTPASAAESVSNLAGKTRTPNDTLNLRSCPSVNCSTLKRIPHDSSLSLSATSGNWFQTSYGGSKGWVNSRYVVLQGTPAKTITRGNVSRKMVSYTFDAGADLGHAGPILDFLKKNNIRASFGIAGKWADANPAHVQRMAKEGHHVFNHTWSHDSFTGFSTGRTSLSPARRTEELVRTDKKIVALTGKSMKPYFRPPYGDYDSSVLRDVGATGYSRNLMWSVDSLGWKGLTATQICNRVVNSMDAATFRGNGYIILFHVGAKSQDVNALPCITKKLKDRGFTVGTVPQVIAP